MRPLDVGDVIADWTTGLNDRKVEEMGSKSARLRKRHELAARRKAAEAKKNRIAAEEARRAALKREAAGQTAQPADPAAPAGNDADEAKPADTAAADGVVPAVDESSRLFKRKVRARKLSKTAAGLHESAETLRKKAKKNGDSVDPETRVEPAGKKGSDKIVAKVIAAIAAVATIGSVVIAAFYAA